MDILTNKELKNVINNSSLFYKYNENLDRESAYEKLNSKIEKINKAEEKAFEDAAAKKEKERIAKENEKKSRSRVSTRSRSTRINPIVKVLTSATFIRAAFGILKKVLK
jgi:hypothetical protein